MRQQGMMQIYEPVTAVTLAWQMSVPYASETWQEYDPVVSAVHACKHSKTQEFFVTLVLYR